MRIAGLGLIGASLLPLGLLGTRPAWNGPLLSAEPSALILMAALYLAGANVLALGFVVLLAGLRGVSLISQRRARRGVVVKMAGANAMMVIVAFTILDDEGQFGREWSESWVAVPVLALFLLVARVGVLVLRRGWKYDAVGANEALEADPRAPVVYIRSFEDDRHVLMTHGRLHKLLSMMQWMTVISLEQELAAIMSRAGPVVGIGKPGEPLPELGAARVYVDDAAWRETITGLMQRARLVVVRVGATENLWWEIDRAVTLLPRQHVVLVSLGYEGQRQPLDARIAQRFGAPTRIRRQTGRLRSILLRTMTTKKNLSLGAVVYFDRDGNPIEETIELRYTWFGYLLAPYRPYKDALEEAFRHVLPHLGVPWTQRRSQVTAMLLAMLAGGLGAHLFYLGQTRRGIRYAAFFWTFVPAVLGWRDAVRLASMDHRRFEEQYGEPPPGPHLIAAHEGR